MSLRTKLHVTCPVAPSNWPVPSDYVEHGASVAEMLVRGAVHPPVVVGLHVQAMPVAEVDRRDRREVAVRLERQVSLEDRLLGSLVEVEANGDSPVLEPRLVHP